MVAFFRRFQSDRSLIAVNCRKWVSSLFLDVTYEAFYRAAIGHTFGAFGAGQSIVEATATELRQGKIIE